ncbi:MAG: M14 family metallopeptidase [Deinococcales bacterium]
MPQRLLIFILSLGLLLNACGKPQQAPSPEGPLAVTQDFFADHALVVVKVTSNDPRTLQELAISFEPIEFQAEAGYLLLDLSYEDFSALSQRKAELGIALEIIEESTLAQSALFQDESLLTSLLSSQSISGYSCYRSVEETYQSARQMVTSYPQLAAWQDVGDSWRKRAGQGGYDLFVLKLTNRAITGNKPKVFITSAIHAREYTTAELMTRFAEYLLSQYGKDADVTWMLDSQEVHLMLQANPDGRKQAEKGIYWRKNDNRNYCASSFKGADLNRNFDFLWNQGGSSANTCSEIYRGPSPASEPETQAVQNYLRSIFPDKRNDDQTSAAPSNYRGLYLDIHSSGELVLWPWGHTQNLAPNASALQRLGRKFAYFNGYHPEQSVGLYPTSGTTDDFAYGRLGVPAFTFELGTAFFESCVSFERNIIPSNTDALLYALRVARAPYRLPAGPDSLNLTLSSINNNRITLSARLDDSRYNNSNGQEVSQNIRLARYYLDIAPWQRGNTPLMMQASDGSFNAKSENVMASIDLSRLSQGRHTVYVRGQDSAGNWDSVSAIFLEVD